MINYVFGPVPSRRLGRSLGVDLVPLKTCTYDCIYCQLGRTTCKTIGREKWVPLDRIVAQLEQRLSGEPDYITLGGSGEPTLHSQIGQLISRIKALTDIPVAVLTNGSLLWMENLRRQLLAADLVVPSLDAGNKAMFHAVNRPHGGISFERMVDGLAAFRQEYSGPLWLEVMVIGGWNATPREIASLASCVERIRPDRVQMNTVTRPPPEADAVRVPAGQLEALCSLFQSPAEVIADFRGIHRESEFVSSRTEVLGMLQRRPCTLEDIACGLGMHRNEVVKYVEELTDQDALEVWTRGNERFYRAVR